MKNVQDSFKKRILIIYASSVIRPLAQPHGAIIISGILREAGFETRLVCPFWKDQGDAFLLDDLNNFKPELICVSIRNHGTAGFDYRETAEKTFYLEIEKIVSICVSVSDAPIVLGGSGFSVDPHRYVNIAGVSVGFIGNSEWDLKKFVFNFLNKGESVEQSIEFIASAVLPGKVIDPILPSGIEPGDYFHALCPEGIKSALAVGGTIPFRTKTGCNGNCIYCVMPTIEGRNFRSRENVTNEIKSAVEYSLGGRLFCADSEFGQDSEHDKAVCRSIIESGLGKKISISGYGDPFFMDKDMTDLMRKAGWKEISLSVDSFSHKMRKIYRKKGSVDDVERGINNLISAGVRVTLNILLGGPGETFYTIFETLEALEKIREKVDICFTFGLTVFPNTPLQKIARRKKFIRYIREEDGNFLASYCSPCLPAEMIKFLESKNFSPVKNSNVIFWNEESNYRDVDFSKKIMQIANGKKSTMLEPEGVLQQMMLEVANLIREGGDQNGKKRGSKKRCSGCGCRVERDREKSHRTG